MNILEFLDSDELTPGTMKGGSWEAWRAALCGMFGLEMTPRRQKLFRKLAGHRSPPAKRVSECYVIAGRRSAKSHTTALVATYMATIGVELEGIAAKLAPGERGFVLCIAVDRAQAAVVFSYVKGILEASPMLSAMVTKWGAESIELSNGITIQIATNNYKAIRGRAAVATIFDEACFYGESESASPAIELYRAAVPALATTGGMLLTISSPWTKKGLVYDKWRKFYAKNSDDVLVLKAPTRVFNPTIPEHIVAAALEDDPDGARTEWMAEWREGVSDLLRRDIVESAVRSEPLELPYRAGVTYYGFADPAGGGADEYTMAIGHLEGERIVVDLVRARHGKPADITAEYAEVFKDYGIRAIVTDKFSGSWAKDEFEKCGIKVEQAAAPKSELYRDSVSRFNSGQVCLPPDPVLVGQFCNLERRVSRNGREVIDHPPGQHEDRANAAAGIMSIVPAGRRTGAGILLPKRWRSAHA